MSDIVDMPYYAKDGMIWKRPEHKHHADGRTTITIGFPVCKMDDAVGDDAAEIVAKLMNAGHVATTAKGRGMSDIVERLRAGGPCVEVGNKCRSVEARSGCECAEAADEIDRLEGEVARLQGILAFIDTATRLQAEG